MTTGEKLALLRKKKGMTQEELAEILKVSRQSVSRWEMDIAFPETEKLIKLSKLFECSIDFLLDENTHKSEESCMDTSVDECYKFIRDCGYFFLATSQVEIASYNLHTRKWIRISGKAEIESSSAPFFN